MTRLYAVAIRTARAWEGFRQNSPLSRLTVAEPFVVDHG
jgi:hypothetical protein